MAWADRRPQARRAADAGVRDALWLGLAQACALFPGISRGGATLTAARLLRFRRHDAHRLSRQMALPVIAGAAVLKAVRLRAYPVPAQARVPFVAGAAAAFGSTLAAGRLLPPGERPLVPFAAYRMALGTAILLRLRSRRSTTMNG
jgi:undecaprenyl-diphosphatase